MIKDELHRTIHKEWNHLSELYIKQLVDKACHCCDQLTCAFLLVQGLKFIQVRKNIAQEIKQKCGENTPNHKVKEGK